MPSNDKSKSNTASAKTAGGVEKRLRRFRSKCPAAVQQRIARARTQRLYLIQRGDLPVHNDNTNTIINDSNSNNNNTTSFNCDFVVLGSTGNVYTVTMGREPHCSCPDHAKGNLCKHILFVWIKVLSVPHDSPLIYQRALLSTEILPVYQQFQERCNNSHSVLARASVQRAYQELTSPSKPKNDNGNDNDDDDKEDNDNERRQVIEGDCPICFDELVPPTNNITNPTEALVFCRGTCGANFHADCILKWKQQQRQSVHGNGDGATCPNCRSEWVEPTTTSHGGVATSPEGYQNLGHLQGQRRTRDTSTYSEWYNNYNGSGNGSGRRNKRWRRW